MGTCTLTTCPFGIVIVKTWPATTPGGTAIVIEVSFEAENDIPETSGFDCAYSVDGATGGAIDGATGGATGGAIAGATGGATGGATA